MKNWFGFLVSITLFATACSPLQQLDKQTARLFQDSTLSHAHVGISLYDPSQQKYLYNYQGEKYFVPASNTKIITCYAALKYLGDSLPGIRYQENDTAVYLIPTGDPTLLHPDFLQQPVISFLQKNPKKIYITDKNWQEKALGAGWSWGDYNEYYMAERSPLPVYGNMVNWVQENDSSVATNEAFEQSPTLYSIPEVNWKVRFNVDTGKKTFHVQRNFHENVFQVTQGLEIKKEQVVPFITNGLESALELLPDTIHHEINLPRRLPKTLTAPHTVYSQPTDSLLKLMMYRSDNFFAEQALLMVSNEKLGIMSNRKIIDTLVASDLRDLPQKPRWADGSGLSRYNLFTPQSMVKVLDKMQQEFGLQRLQVIFPTGGNGTLRNFYKQDSGAIYAKTGTLSGVVALSGYVLTKKNKWLIFSVLVNNHTGDAVAVRRQVEAWIRSIRQKY